MATNFPTSIDVLTNPVGTDTTTAVDHAAQHTNANDAVEAIEAKVGADGSTVTTSHDYKLNEVTTTDKAVSKTATQTLTNKTLTTPVIPSFYQDAGLTKLMTVPDTASDTLTAIAATQTLTNKTLTSPVINTPTITIPQINMSSDANGDLYTRTADVFSRLPMGNATQFLRVNSGGTALEYADTSVLNLTTSVDVYTANGTWTKPGGLVFIVVEVQAGGGGGGTVYHITYQGAGSGGGGGYSKKTILAASLGATETVTVGAEGAGGATGANNPGSAGGTSSFGTYISATGGAGGEGGGMQVNGGNGGSGSGGNINIAGGEGGTGGSSTDNPSISGPGGRSQLGNGGALNCCVSGASDGKAASGYGGGGGGGAVVASAATALGAAGTGGIVIVTNYYTP